jgi:hypothetical protein
MGFCFEPLLAPLAPGVGWRPVPPTIETGIGFVLLPKGAPLFAVWASTADARNENAKNVANATLLVRAIKPPLQCRTSNFPAPNLMTGANNSISARLFQY